MIREASRIGTQQSAFRIHTHPLSQNARDKRLEYNYKADRAMRLYISFFIGNVNIGKCFYEIASASFSWAVEGEISVVERDGRGESKVCRRLAGGGDVLMSQRQPDGFEVQLEAYWTRSWEACALVPAPPLISSLTLHLT